MKKKIYSACAITILLMLNANFNLRSSGLIHDLGINVGFNTFRLLGNNIAIKPLHEIGGGLRFIEPGFDIAAVMFMDDNYKHRIIVGGEYTFMSVRDIAPLPNLSYTYQNHTVQLADFYAGYHYSFLKAQFQNVRLYAGIELMANNMVANEYQWGINDFGKITEEHLDKKFTPRFGSRARFGFEGRLKENIYANIGFSAGIYNLLGRNNDTGELFNRINFLKAEESLQPFYNILISFQYRFNDK